MTHRRGLGRKTHCWLNTALPLLLLTAAKGAEIKITTDRNDSSEATPAFRFKAVPSPARNDAGAKATFQLVEGRRDANGGDLNVLNDGQAPLDEDAPSANFFFRAGTAGGRLLADLGREMEIRQVNTYSWHSGTRAPQVYRLYGSDGKGVGFEPQPKQGTAPETCGWKPLAQVDTRPASGPAGGQHGVSISAAGGFMGPYRYLLFDIARTEDQDAFGNTFFSEIDVLDLHGPAPEAIDASAPAPIRETMEAEGGKYKITLDTTEAPDLTAWVQKEIVPLVREWYPKLVTMLPSEGYQAPTNFSIVFRKDMRGVADTSGTRIRCAARWFRQNLQGEARGALFHEMVHVVQQYGRGPRAPGSTRPPSWLTEGLTDYLRFYHYEPQTRGAEISARNLARARYDGSYRITANFLHWVCQEHGQDFVPRLNAAIREGKYSEELWRRLTGRSVQELGSAWKTALEKKLGPQAPASPAPADKSAPRQAVPSGG
jgi:hypothetical protein